MVCPPCKQAGDYHQAAIQIAKLMSREVSALEADTAKGLHEQCEYLGTCSCQHVIGGVINRGQPS